ncbi:MAG: hypothetical protein FJY17_00890 [Bacteroidetes bacterium]|nr:hypothetical protein [Bacteroidota bacterium]
MITKQHIITGITVVLAIVFSLFIVGKNTKLHSKISVLEGQKQQLEERIKELAEERLEVLDSIATTQIQIENLLSEDIKLKQKNERLEAQVKNIKLKYEKANNHTINYNTDSIRRYFTDFN